MRKLSELYGLVIECIESGVEDYTCYAIDALVYNRDITSDEEYKLKDNFRSNRSIAHKKYGATLGGYAWWGNGVDDCNNRRSFLKYLIKLCKEQDI